MSKSSRAPLAVFLPDLSPGGAERMHIHLACEWIKQGVPVELVVMRRTGKLLDSLPSQIRVHSLDVDRYRHALFPLIRYIRKESPLGIKAAMWPLTVLVPLAARIARYSGRVVVSEHEPLSRAYDNRSPWHRLFLRSSQMIGYRMASCRVAVSDGVASDLSRLSGLPRSAFDVIYNPAARGAVSSKLDAPLLLRGDSRPVILAVGTLKAVKRFDLLIEAFARLPKPLGASLCIVGEGDQRGALEEVVQGFGVADRVFMPGFDEDTSRWYASADLFVLSSDYEGFGNVIVEALEHGLPVVSTDCPYGPREILDHGRFGTLVPVGDVEALAQAMQGALGREHDKEALKARAADFSVTKAADAYLDQLLPNWRQSQTSEAVGR